MPRPGGLESASAATLAAAMATAAVGGSSSGTAGHEPREQDKFLPIANVSRIMKRVVPSHVRVGKDAREAVQEAVSEFISFITSEASDKCQQEKRKTINGDDVLWAMATLGFDDYIEPLQLYLHKVSYVAVAVAAA